jgi:cell fate regulator YaaT (PSP1 superfamily)
MTGVVSIRFKQCGKMYDFSVDNIELRAGDLVVVESDFGLNIARAVHLRTSEAAAGRELKRVVRKANEEDMRQREENKALEHEARLYCNERIMARGLPMKLISTESTLDKKRVVFYFTAEGRIDFRELVKDLAAKFKTRIEMRQIGVRDEAKLIGGLGVCGRELCCKTHLTSFEPISIRMAKKQEMVLNVGKLSGLCSRLMCCLRYEYDGPASGAAVQDEETAMEKDQEPSETPAPRQRLERKPHQREFKPRDNAQPRREQPQQDQPQPQPLVVVAEPPVAQPAPEVEEEELDGEEPIAAEGTEPTAPKAEGAPQDQQRRRRRRHRRKRRSKE